MSHTITIYDSAVINRHAKRGEVLELGRTLDHLAQREAPNGLDRADILLLAKDEAGDNVVHAALLNVSPRETTLGGAWNPRPLGGFRVDPEGSMRQTEFSSPKESPATLLSTRPAPWTLKVSCRSNQNTKSRDIVSTDPNTAAAVH